MLKIKIMLLGLLTTVVLAGCNQTTQKTNQDVDVTANEVAKEAVLENVLPLQKVLNEQTYLDEVREIDIQQKSDSEQSDHVQVTLTLSGLADDSINAERKVYQFKKVQDQWQQQGESVNTQRCARGNDTTSFHSKLCP